MRAILVQIHPIHILLEGDGIGNAVEVGVRQEQMRRIGEERMLRSSRLDGDQTLARDAGQSFTIQQGDGHLPGLHVTGI